VEGQPGPSDKVRCDSEGSMFLQTVERREIARRVLTVVMMKGSSPSLNCRQRWTAEVMTSFKAAS